MEGKLMKVDVRVAGMSCAHCVARVTEELMLIEGVESVSIDLPAGRVEIIADRTLDATQLAAAVDEAGYALLPA